ncbi:MAG: hypothetical protein GY723_19980 [bacterium]|nr:hypothetical protein [bacterium]MCP5070668.1 hypothetical protein [bacterium]
MRRKNRSGRPAWRAALLCLCLLTAPMAAQAESPAKELGMGVAIVGANLVYGPVKLLYALGGGLVATVAWAFSGGDVAVARPIVDASLRGDYFVSTDQLRGKDELEFIGRKPVHDQARDQGWDVAAPSEPEGF